MRQKHPQVETLHKKRIVRRYQEGGTVARTRRRIGIPPARRRARPEGPQSAPSKRVWRPLAAGPVPVRRLDERMLVLAAKNIPHVLSPTDRELYVPAEDEAFALEEIRAFERETERRVPPPSPPARDNAIGVVCLFALLVMWHGLRSHWFVFSLPDPPFPADPNAWPGLFGLDKLRARDFGEWRLCVTALTLHADARHLFGNVGFGLFFFIPLCRRAGLGAGLAAALAGGALGNACTALAYGRMGTPAPGAGLSLGFSTALFAALGVLCVQNAADMIRARSYVAARETGYAPGAGAIVRAGAAPLAAGLALLGFLGGGGEVHTDYTAHIFGFICGLGTGLPLQAAETRLRALPGKKRSAADAALGASALLLPAWAWYSVLSGR